MDGKTALQLFFGCDVSDISEIVVFTPLPTSNLGDFMALCDEIRVEFSGWVGSGFTALAKGNPITVICPGTGSSQIGDAVLAVSYGPCAAAIFVGSVGGLVGNMNVGDIIVVEDAVIGEGFSRYHLAEGRLKDAFGQISRADDVLLDYVWSQVQTLARSFDVAAHKGRIFTTESLFAETERFLQELVGRGCIGIEKEASAFYTAAKKAKIRATAVLCISDMPLHQKSLFVGRSREEEEKRVRVRHDIIPQIVMSLVPDVHRLGGPLQTLPQDSHSN